MNEKRRAVLMASLPVLATAQETARPAGRDEAATHTDVRA